MGNPQGDRGRESRKGNRKGNRKGSQKEAPLKVNPEDWKPQRHKRGASSASKSDGRQEKRHKAFFR